MFLQVFLDRYKFRGLRNWKQTGLKKKIFKNRITLLPPYTALRDYGFLGEVRTLIVFSSSLHLNVF